MCLDQYGLTNTLVGHRLEAATKVWGRWRHLFSTPLAPVHDRTHKTHEIVVASASWAARLWDTMGRGTPAGGEQKKMKNGPHTIFEGKQL